MKQKLAIVLCLVLLTVFAVGVVTAYADGVSLNDAPGNSIVQGLKGFATGGWGKALFFVCLLVGIICIVFTRQRAFGLIALVFGILLGVYGGLGESLWNLFTSWGNG
jgi:hypothetical protein